MTDPARHAYIRPSLLTVSPSNSLGPTHMAPDVRGAIDAFHSCGWTVTIVGGPKAVRAPGIRVGWRSSLEDPDPGAWLLTDDVADDHWARPLGLRTAFVGPHLEHHPAPARCDLEFRDLRTAALEILSSEPSPRPSSIVSNASL